MPDVHPLDRPVWSALVGGWSHLAEGDGLAWRLNRSCGVFGAAADDSSESAAALAALVPPDQELWTVERRGTVASSGVRIVRQAECVQMLADAIAPVASLDGQFAVLTDADGPEMLALATLTRPGPYVRHTNRLGRFIGIRSDGQLVAMAGERMRMPDFAEVSGVCTHPDFRGRGYAAALMRGVAQRMLARGETPFLHAYADNAGAIGLYESLGFRTRCEVTASVLVRD